MSAPTDPPVKKKPRRAGFQEQFLQQLRVMLDRESQNQNNSTAVQWSADGSSFIIMDQLEFEKHFIPTYFDKPIMFSSYLSKLYRWGFRRIPNERSDCYEFCLPTFKRLGVDSAPASAATGGDDSIQIGHGSKPTLQSARGGTFSPTPLASLSPCSPTTSYLAYSRASQDKIRASTTW